jgi:hypothetical protein
MKHDNQRRSWGWRFYRRVRRFLGPSFRELLRTGKVVQTLWDSARLQRKQRDYVRRAGERAIELLRQGKLQDMYLERILAKLDRSERILARQDLLLRSYQQRGDIKEVLRIDRQQNKDQLEPV